MLLSRHMSTTTILAMIGMNTYIHIHPGLASKSTQSLHRFISFIANTWLLHLHFSNDTTCVLLPHTASHCLGLKPTGYTRSCPPPELAHTYRFKQPKLSLQNLNSKISPVSKTTVELATLMDSNSGIHQLMILLHRGLSPLLPSAPLAKIR